MIDPDDLRQGEVLFLASGRRHDDAGGQALPQRVQRRLVLEVLGLQRLPLPLERLHLGPVRDALQLQPPQAQADPLLRGS